MIYQLLYCINNCIGISWVVLYIVVLYVTLNVYGEMYALLQYGSYTFENLASTFSIMKQLPATPAGPVH